MDRQGCVSAKVGSAVFIWGGETAKGRSTAHLKTLKLFDSRTEKWMTRSIKGQHPPGYKYCASAQDGNLVYIYGGLDEDNLATGSLYCLDLESYSCRKLSGEVSGGPKKTEKGGMVVHGDKIFLFGGVTSDLDKTDELHIFDLSTGLWSSPATTGSKPPPCDSFSFVKVKNDTAMIFGGYSNKEGTSDDLYSLDLNTMHWTKILHKNKEPWPEGRYDHAACCIGVDTNNTQLMIIGGRVSGRYYDDMWLLDITSMTWRKVSSDERMACSEHAAVIVQITEDVSEVVLVGGSMPGVYISSKTTIVRLEKKHPDLAAGSSPDKWKVTDTADDAQLGKRERLQYKKDLQEKEIEGACRKVIEEQISILIQIARLNFLGLPRSGKSTTIKRLIGEIFNIIQANLPKEQPSTGVAERNQVIIKSISKCIGFTSQRSKWTAKDLLGESGVLNQLIKEVAKLGSSAQVDLQKPVQVATEAAQPLIDEVATPSSVTPHEDKPPVQQPQQEASPHDVAIGVSFNAEDVLASFQEAVSSEDFNALKYLLEDTIYLINTDTGGQTQFLDLMSRFLMGPALNLIVSRLVDSLDQVYKIYCTNEEGIRSAEEDSVVTVEEVIFQALASIACLKASYDPEESGESKEKDLSIQLQECSSKAMFVGTFRDMVTQEEYEKKDKILQQKIEQTEFYHKKLVLYSSKDHLMHTLDNLEGGQEEIEAFQSILEENIRKYFEKIESPLSWLMLSVSIRHQQKRTMTLRECRGMASKLGITPADLPKALWFLHYRIGVILYYPEIPGFSELIICDVQVVFDAATKLVKKTFTFENVGKKAAEMFKEKAQFTMADLQVATKGSVTDLIPLEKLVVLLEHHKILAPLPQCEEDDGEVFYFMPCILKSATPDELLDIRSSSEVAPLMFRYECGYMPLGVFSSLIIQLVSHHKDWRLIVDSPRRNKVEFHIGKKYDTVTLVSRPTFMEVTLFRRPGATRLTSSICADVRATLTTALEGVHADLKFHCTAKFQYAFECPTHPGKEHLSLVSKEDEDTLLCMENLKRMDAMDMTDVKHQVWFKKINETSLGEHSTQGQTLWGSQILEMNYFYSIRFYDQSTGKEEELRIVDEICANWETIGGILGFKAADIEAVRNAGAGKTPQQCLCDIITRWIQNASQMPCSQRYPNNWRGVYNLLEASKQSTIANHLKAAIETIRSDLHGNFDKVPPSRGFHGLPTAETTKPVISPKEESMNQRDSGHSISATDVTPPKSTKKKKRSKMDKELLACWLKENGVEEHDIKILKSKNVSEILFLKLKAGDKWTSGLSEVTLEILAELQDELRDS